jgi:fatty-acyl-CoA synthase
MAESSYVHGASDKPLLGSTIGQYFDAICAQYADCEALVVRHQDVRLTYAALRRKVDQLACALMRLGLQPGERIGIWSPNNLEWVLTQFATAKSGLILVNINPAYQRAELDYALNKVGCRALILAPRFKTTDYLAILNDLAPELARSSPGNLKAAKLSQLEFVVRLGAEKSAGAYNFDELQLTPSPEQLAALEACGKRLQFDDPINIQFTSGTTGSPKGATLTHHNILNNGYFIGEAMKLTSADRLCIPVPLYHCFGMVLGNLACLTHGSNMIFPGEGFDPP